MTSVERLQLNDWIEKRERTCYEYDHPVLEELEYVTSRNEEVVRVGDNQDFHWGKAFHLRVGQDYGATGEMLYNTRDKWVNDIVALEILEIFTT